jgi:acetaldehyde dehydrogenase (acetylating)
MSDSARINLTNCESKPFELYESLDVKNKEKYLNTGNQQRSKLSDSFFSQTNIDHLQDTIIRQIYKKTDGKYSIVKQNEDEIVIVMKSIFIQNGRNNDNNINLQINELNKLVLNYCVGNVYTNLLQYVKYVDDITKENTVMDMPQNVDIKGSKTLMPNHFI